MTWRGPIRRPVTSVVRGNTELSGNSGPIPLPSPASVQGWRMRSTWQPIVSLGVGKTVDYDIWFCPLPWMKRDAVGSKRILKEYIPLPCYACAFSVQRSRKASKSTKLNRTAEVQHDQAMWTPTTWKMLTCRLVAISVCVGISRASRETAQPPLLLGVALTRCA